MRTILHIGLIASLLLWASPLMAAEAPWQSPTSVRIYPQGARLTVMLNTPLTLKGSEAQAVFYLPAEAQDIDISYGKLAPSQWSSSTVPGDKLSGDIASQKAAIMEKISKTQGQIAALNARMALWATPPTTVLTPEQMQARQTALDSVLPAAQQELAAQQQALQDLEKQRDLLPTTTSLAQKITAVFPAEAQKGENILIYRYSLPNCGWQPTYNIRALPDKDVVEIKLIAKVWQFSGMNWGPNTVIALLPQGYAYREPAPLRPWQIRTGDPAPAPLAMPRARMAAPMAVKMDAAVENMALESPRMQDSSAYTFWELGERPLPEGTAYINLNSDTLQSPLLWLARPSISSDVWLQAKPTLTKQRQWPAGEAAYYIDNDSVGSGTFAPKGASVTLNFGIDYRVTVENASDPRLSGKEGLLDKRKTWTWQWAFTVHNGRPTPVTVRIEEAEPQLGDKALTITYTTEPAPQLGPDHTLYWDVEVPAESKHNLKYGVTLSAPQNLKVQPGK